MESEADCPKIAFASDNAYFEGLLVAAWSVAASAAHPEYVDIYVLDGGITDENWNFLRCLLESYKCGLHRIPVNQESHFDNLSTWHGASKMTYARLLLPDLLPQLKHIIYCDVDFIWAKDITELWRERNCDVILQFIPVTRWKIGANELVWCWEHGFSLKERRYFCAGLLLMNLDLFRRENLHGKALEILRNAKTPPPFVDQTALNVLMANRNDAGFLDYHWSVETGEYGKLTEDVPMAVHYASDAPWKSVQTVHHMLTEPYFAWHRIHAKLRHISTWHSLRQCNSAVGIIISRLAYVLASGFPPFRWLVLCYLRYVKRSRDWWYQEPYMKAVKFSPVKTLLEK